MEDFDAALSSSEELAYVDPHAPVVSNRPVGSAMKKFVRKLVFFYGMHITEQTTKFSTTMARTTRLLGRRVDVLEQALPTASPEVRSITAALDPGREGEALADAVGRAFAGTEGRVAVGECGDGVLLGPLAAAGVDAYGVEPRAARADAAVVAGFEVRESEVLDHLALVPAGALGGVVLVGCIDRMPIGARVEALHAAARAVRARRADRGGGRAGRADHDRSPGPRRPDRGAPVAGARPGRSSSTPPAVAVLGRRTVRSRRGRARCW